MPFAFPAAAPAAAALVCSTSPSSPGLWIRTEMFSFDGLIWVAPALAVASCVFAAA